MLNSAAVRSTNLSLQTFEEAGWLPQRNPEQYHKGKAFWYNGVYLALLAAMPAFRRGTPAHVRAYSKRMPAPRLARFIVGRRLLKINCFGW